MPTEIGDGGLQKSNGVFEKSDTPITLVAQDATNYTCFVIVIDMKFSLFFRLRLSTDGAATILLLQHLVILFNSNAVLTFQLPTSSQNSSAFWVIACPLGYIISALLSTRWVTKT